MLLVAEKIFRIGVQQLWNQDDRWFVTITNRTYQSEVEIPEDKVPCWLKVLDVLSPPLKF